MSAIAGAGLAGALCLGPLQRRADQRRRAEAA
jgi:hypothetical protein